MLSSVRKPLPQVTGISPKEGPPGTKVTIWGENLGVEHRDIIALRICGVDCLLTAEWKSPKKIIARTGNCKGKGDIIVVTKSGGVGSSTVQFRSYAIVIGPLQDSAVWVAETYSFHEGYGRNRAAAHALEHSTEVDDPLGISDESNDKKLPVATLQEWFPDKNGNTSSEEFEPKWFLLENHHGTKFDDLKAGLSQLKHRATQRSEGPKEFLKINLTTFLDCYQVLTDMYGKLMEDKEQAPESGPTAPLEEVLRKSNDAADKLFHDVLNRKDKADATRSTLAVLHRFKFLFNLPLTLDRNIKKGDYDLVITDYTRARSLFGDTDVQVFRKVYQEVENRIEKFRHLLFDKLMQLPSSVDEQKKLIRYLAHLETPGDPAWECLVNMHKWLVGLLHKCKTEHVEKDEAQAAAPQVLLTATRVTTVALTGRHTRGVKAPQRVLFVEHLSRLLTEHLPDLWRLGQTYLSGKLYKEKRLRIESSRLERFQRMILELIDLFTKLIRAALLPHSLAKLDADRRATYGLWRDTSQSSSPAGWLPSCVRSVRSCILSVAPLDLHEDSMESLQNLAFDMRTNCMGALLKQAIEDIRRLQEKETWAVDADDERGGSTVLPALFENIASETLQHLQEVVHAKPTEKQLFEDAAIRQQTTDMCTQVLKAFAGTLETLAMTGNSEEGGSTSLRRSSVSPDKYTGGTEQSSALPFDKRLIVMMSNCNHTREHVLPRLVDSLERYSYPDTAKIQSAASYCYQSLDEKLFDKYIEEKENPIIGVLEQNMFAGKFDWSKCARPRGVRMYLKEALLGMIQVHSEVYSISPRFVPRVMLSLVEHVMDEVSRLFQCVGEFSPNGALQARLEILVLEHALGFYKTSETCAALSEALNCLPELSKEENRVVEDQLSRFQSQMRFHLMCFQVQPTVQAAAAAPTAADSI